MLATATLIALLNTGVDPDGHVILTVRQDADTSLWIAKLSPASDEPAIEVNGVLLQTPPSRGLEGALYTLEDRSRKAVLRLF